MFLVINLAIFEVRWEIGAAAFNHWKLPITCHVIFPVTVISQFFRVSCLCRITVCNVSGTFRNGTGTFRNGMERYGNGMERYVERYGTVRERYGNGTWNGTWNGSGTVQFANELGFLLKR